VNLNILPLALGVDPLHRVADPAVHVPERERRPAVAEEEEELMDALRVLRQVIPEVIGILQVGLRVALLCSDNRRRAR